ncbi:MAG: biotin/lipoyl-binding protein, partial [Anaerolineae bacterium]
MRKKWWLVVLLAALVVGGLLTYRAWRSGADQAAAQTEVETAAVERGTLRITVDGSGSLSAQQEVEVPFETGGRVVEILVQSGSVVEAGDLLGRLDERDARRAVADAELRLKQAQVSLASAQL